MVELAHPYFLIFEFLIYGLFAACVCHAIRQGQHRSLELVFTGLYGVLLEWLTIKQLQAYHYGRFLIMLDGAPLSIGLGWAVIIYTGMTFTDRIQLPDAVRPILDALLALMVDLSLDVIAIRLGMWTWNGVGLNQQWFGVPWVNFWGWFIVVWSYSGFIRALRGWRAYRFRKWLYVPLAVFLSLMVLVVSSELYHSLSNNNSDETIGTLGLILGSLVIVFNCRPRIAYAGPPEPVVIAVPLAFHGFAILAGIVYGIYTQTPALIAIGVILLVVSVLVHLWPWWFTRVKAH